MLFNPTVIFSLLLALPFAAAVKAPRMAYPKPLLATTPEGDVSQTSLEPILQRRGEGQWLVKVQHGTKSSPIQFTVLMTHTESIPTGCSEALDSVQVAMERKARDRRAGEDPESWVLIRAMREHTLAQVFWQIEHNVAELRRMAARLPLPEHGRAGRLSHLEREWQRLKHSASQVTTIPPTVRQHTERHH